MQPSHLISLAALSALAPSLAPSPSAPRRVIKTYTKAERAKIKAARRRRKKRR